MISAIRPLVTAVAAGFLFAGAAYAAEPEVLLVIKNHRFEPAEVKVPAGQRIKLVVHNQDGTPEEFESHSLNREKVDARRREGHDLHRPAQARPLRLLRRIQRKDRQGRRRRRVGSIPCSPPRSSSFANRSKPRCSSASSPRQRGSFRGARAGSPAASPPACSAPLALALMAQQVSGWFDGLGQDVVNIAVLSVALAMLLWHCIWVATHSKEMALEARQLGASVQGGQRKPWALIDGRRAGGAARGRRDRALRGRSAHRRRRREPRRGRARRRDRRGAGRRRGLDHLRRALAHPGAARLHRHECVDRDPGRLDRQPARASRSRRRASSNAGVPRCGTHPKPSRPTRRWAPCCMRWSAMTRGPPRPRSPRTSPCSR